MSSPTADDSLGNSFVPDDFDVPLVYETDFFRLRKLRAADVDKDYEAVMANAEMLQSHFGNGWPSEDFSLAENLADLVEHEREFDERIAFAYTVVSLDEQRCLGCVYINPPREHPNDARVSLWARPDTDKEALDLILFREVKVWLAQAWPFEAVLFLGRNEDGSWYPI